MRASISKGEIRGKGIAPPSKSYTVRALMCAALADGQSEIIGPLDSDDTRAAADVLGKVGVRIRRGKAGWQVQGGTLHKPDSNLFCRESAATLRFMTAISALVPGRCRLTAAPSLAVRPIDPLLEALRQMGVNCYREDETAVVVEGGSLQGGIAKLAGDVSSQFVTALLLAAPLAAQDVSIRLTTPLESKPFVLMTLECLEAFGIRVSYPRDLGELVVPRQVYQPARYRVEGDWSSASYLLALGAVGGEAEVANLNPESQQGDRIILDFLRDMGTSVTIGENEVRVTRSELKSVRADLTDCIDLLPTMAVLAAAAQGVSELTGVARARLKESNRVAAVREGLERMGIKVKEAENRLTITGGRAHGALIDSRGDHRLAMAFSVLGSVVGETTIDDAACVSKTYPDFWDALKNLGGEVQIDGK